MPHGRIMLHQPSNSVSRTTAHDVMIKALELQETKQRLVSIISRHTGVPEAEVGNDRTLTRALARCQKRLLFFKKNGLCIVT